MGEEDHYYYTALLENKLILGQTTIMQQRITKISLHQAEGRTEGTNLYCATGPNVYGSTSHQSTSRQAHDVGVCKSAHGHYHNMFP